MIKIFTSTISYQTLKKENRPIKPVFFFHPNGVKQCPFTQHPQFTVKHPAYRFCTVSTPSTTLQFVSGPGLKILEFIRSQETAKTSEPPHPLSNRAVQSPSRATTHQSPSPTSRSLDLPKSTENPSPTSTALRQTYPKVSCATVPNHCRASLLG